MHLEHKVQIEQRAAFRLVTQIFLINDIKSCLGNKIVDNQPALYMMLLQLIGRKREKGRGIVFDTLKLLLHILEVFSLFYSLKVGQGVDCILFLQFFFFFLELFESDSLCSPQYLLSLL